MAETEIGSVSDYFAHPMVAGIDLTGELGQGDKIRIAGHTTDIEITVGSLQLNHENVEVGRPGQSVGVKVPDRVRKGDKVFLVSRAA